MRFIEFTDIYKNKHLINIDHITDIVSEYENITTIYLDVYEKWVEGRDQERIQVMETLDEIKGLIRQAEAKQ